MSKTHNQRQNPLQVGQAGITNTLIWLVVFALFGAGVVVNTLMVDIATPIRLVAWILLTAACLGLASITAQGKAWQAFSKSAWVELQRVVWPQKQETLQTTLIVMAMVLLVSIIIWIVDSGLLVLIGILTGQRG